MDWQAYERRMQWFRHDRFGMFIHWGLYSIPARGEWVMQAERMTDEQYRRYFEEFDPSGYDPREWARLLPFRQPVYGLQIHGQLRPRSGAGIRGGVPR